MITDKLIMAAGWRGKPSTIGSAYGGGYYAGKISTAGNGVATHYLIVSPKATGETQAVFGAGDSSIGVSSEIDGPTNTATAVANGAGYAAANFCNDLVIDGFADWYLPAIKELEVVFYFLKPTTRANTAGYGSNVYAVSPEPISTHHTAGCLRTVVYPSTLLLSMGDNHSAVEFGRVVRVFGASGA